MNRKEIIKNLRYKAENIKTHMPLQVFSEAADMLEEYELIINSLIKDCIGLDFICDKLGVSEWCEEHCNGNTPDIECVRKYYKEQNMDTNKKIELLEKEVAGLKERIEVCNIEISKRNVANCRESNKYISPDKCTWKDDKKGEEIVIRY